MNYFARCLRVLEPATSRTITDEKSSIIVSSFCADGTCEDTHALVRLLTCGCYAPLRCEQQQPRSTAQINPAPRAHLYLAPSTATGISVEYGYAGMP